MVAVNRSLVLCVVLLALVPGVAGAQEAQTEHTLKLTGESPPATIGDVAWLAGHWHGEAMGGSVDEIYSPPAGGALLGMFRLVKDGKPSFYELITLAEENGSLVLRLKHFNADMTGWEEKDESFTTRLIQAKPGKAYFDGLTFLQDGPKKLAIYVASKKKDGSVSELEFLFERVEP